MRCAKITLTFCLALWALYTFAQDSTFIMSYVVKVDSVSQQELYKRAQNWAETTFVSAKKITVVNDTANCILVLNPAFLISLKGENGELPAGYIKYQITLQCKDGRYKLSLTDFTHHPGESSFGTGGNLNNAKPKCGYFVMAKGVWFNIREKALGYANHIRQLVQAAMDTTPKTNTNKTDDW